MVLNLSDLLRLRVLVIEDNRDDYTLLVDHLEAFGTEVISRRVDTEVDLRQAIPQGWDVVFSDYSMPRLNGLRALEIVREVDDNVPFIYVSGTIGETAAVKAIKSGAQNYVMKSDYGRLVPTLERELEDALQRRKQREMDERLRKLSLAISQSADSVFITDDQGVIEYVNPAFERLTGYVQSEIVGKTSSVLYSGQQGNSLYAAVGNAIKEGKTYRGTMVNRRKDGSLFHEEKVVTPLFNESGVLTHFVSTGRDITARIEAEQARRRMHAVMEATPDLVAIVEANGNLLYLNSAGREMLGADRLAEDPQAFSDKNPSNKNHSENLWPLLDLDTLEQIRTVVLPHARREGQWRGELDIQPALPGLPAKPFSLIALALKEGISQSAYFSLIAHDISERRRFEAALQFQEAHDPLTKLPNRHYLLRCLKNTLIRADQNQTSVAVLLLDIHQFRRINDSLGHIAGDELLKAVARRLQGFFSSHEIIARLGSDEFCVVMESVHSQQTVVNRLNEILPVIKAAVNIDGQEIFLNCSMGVTLYPADYADETDLVRHANIAMYRAKQLGVDQYQFYHPAMNVDGPDVLQLETQLRYAIENHELFLFYQPQIDLKQNAIIGFEALLRWKTGGRVISPADFIPLLESTGLIHEVGLWIVEQACVQYHVFKHVLADVKISVNVSAVQLQDRQFPKRVYDLVQRYRVPREALELEITENIVMQDPEWAAQVMVMLNNYGIRTAIDDFGTGYSSLAYLKRFPVSVLKIDQSFIRDVISDTSDAAIVEASITLAHKLGLQVIAEGVENAEQLCFLQNLECDQVQGYLISRPLPQEEVASFVSGASWRH